MRFSIQPFTVIGNEFIDIRLIFIEDLNDAPSISVTILELAKVIIFVWNVLEAKTVFLRFAG
jgi:hypothetical protein